MAHYRSSITASHSSSGACPSPWERHQAQLSTEYEDIHKRLENFPNSFHLEDHRKLGDNTLRSIRNHLEAALKAGYKTNMETAQSLNLLSFVFFKLKESGKALDCVNEALNLEGQHENIVSLANKTYILWHMGKFRRREDPEDQFYKLEKLRESKDFAYLTVKATAELAASYMRFGHNFNKNAIATFNEVIPEGREPEVWSWKLARAVAYRHTLDLQHAPHACGEEDDKHMKVLQMLQEIADKSDSPQLKGNALAEIALVLRTTWDSETSQALRNVVEAGPMKICKDALKCDENEPSVLRKVGQIFRYYKDVYNSLKYLKKAVKLQPTSAAYHHLGLTYKAFATEHKYGTLRKRRGRRLRGRKRGRQQGQEVAQASREHGDTDMNQDHRDVYVSGQTEGKNSVRAESTIQNQNRGRRGRGHKQVEPGAARRGSGASHWRGRGRGNIHTSKQDVQSEVRQSSHASSGTGKGAAEGIPMETDDTCEDVRGAAYSQTAQNNRKNPCPERVQREHTHVQSRGCRSGYLGQEQSQRPTDDTAYHGHPQQLLSRQRQRYGEADFQLHCQESFLTPLPRSESETLQSSDSETELKQVMHETACGDTESDDDLEPDGPRSSKPDRLSKTIKSLPNEGVTRFSRDDMYVTETLENLQKAVEFSAEENTRAQYDLALMHKALDEYDEALECLDKICENASAGALDIIAAYEQAGLILYERAEKLIGEEDRNRQKEMADGMLFKALITASRLYSKSADLQGRFNSVFQSPVALLKAVQESDKSHQDKEKERAKLLRLIHKYKKSLSVLKKMAALDPQCEDDADYQVILIQNQCDMGRFDDAVMSFELLKTTQLGKEVRERLEKSDKHYVLSMYLQSQRHSLDQPGSKAGLFIRNIFEDNFRHPSSNANERAVKDATSKENIATEVYVRNRFATACHVAVVLDDEEEEEIQGIAKTLADILRKCGLTVISSDDDSLRGGCQYDFYIIDKIEKDLFVVLVGNNPVSELLKFQIQATTKANVPIAILLVNGASLPQELQGYRFMIFPDELLTAQQTTDATMSVISFLLSK